MTSNVVVALSRYFHMQMIVVTVAIINHDASQALCHRGCHYIKRSLYHVITVLPYQAGSAVLRTQYVQRSLYHFMIVLLYLEESIFIAIKLAKHHKYEITLQ